MNKLSLGLLGSAISGGLLYAFWPVNPRKKVVTAAMKDLGASDATKYWRDVMPGATGGFPPSWCGAYTLWALHQAGLAKDWNWVVEKGYMSKLPTTKTPKMGDMAYFAKLQHQAIVKSVNPNGTVTLINGNGIGGKVTLSDKPIKDVTAFYSIEPLLKVA